MMSPEQKAAWLADRCGRLGASRMRDAMAFRKDGKPTAERTKLQYELLAERVTGSNVRHFVTPAMQDGLDYEDEMFDQFVERTGRNVRLSHLYHHPTIENFLCTPDRELDDGLMEGKVPTMQTFVQWKLEGVVPEEHKPQMIAQCLCTGKSWVGFLAYCPWIPDPKLNMFLRKFVPSAEEMAAVEAAAVKFLDELEELFSRFVEAE